jgi:hypothetical protein
MFLLMVYKRYIKRDGKVFGPYYYESYRDKEGKVKTKFVSGPGVYSSKGSVTEKNKYNWRIMIALFAVFVLIIVSGVFFATNQAGQDMLVRGVYDFGSSIAELGSETFLAITGLVAEDESNNEGGVDSDNTNIVDDTGDLVGDGENPENIYEDSENIEENYGGEGSGGLESVEESESKEDTDEGIEKESGETTEENEKLKKDKKEKEDNSKKKDGENGEETKNKDNETIIVEVNESVKNDENESEFFDGNESGNYTISEDKNESVVENNESAVDVREINETMIIEENESVILGVGKSIVNARIVIDRPVKWVKIINIDELDNLIVEIPKTAMDISIRTGDEIQKTLNDLEQYEELIESADRSDLASGLITGNVVSDVRKEEGLLNKLLSWLEGLSITGNVIQEEELEGDIIVTEVSKIIDLKNIVAETGVSEIAIEYYTEAPVKSEEDLDSGGKKIIISGPDEPKYNDVLAYVEISEVINVGEPEKIKIYWEEEGEYVLFIVDDLDSDGLIDYVEWNVDHLSNQTFDISFETGNSPPTTEITTFGNGEKEVVLQDFDNSFVVINKNVEVKNASLISDGNLNIAGSDFESGMVNFGQVLNNYTGEQNESVIFVPISGASGTKLSNLSVTQEIRGIVLGNESLEIIDLNVLFHDSEGEDLEFGNEEIGGVNVSIIDGVVSLTDINLSGVEQLRFTAFDGALTGYTNYFKVLPFGFQVITPELSSEEVYSLNENAEIDFEYLAKEELERNGEWDEEYELFEEDSEKNDEEIKILENKVKDDEARLSESEKALKKQEGKFVKESDEINVKVYRNGELEEIKIEIEELREGKFKLRLENKREFRAGKYKVEVELTKNGVIYNEEIDFSWGVLAINTNKATYLENEEAFIGIAVLDDEGRMVCDAEVTLEITSPLNQTSVLSTSNGQITISPECNVYGVTSLPDYYTYYSVSNEGNYTMNLTAITPNGKKSIEDTFFVVREIEFDVSRDGPTRIYPVVPYTMTFNILANNNYNGDIVEYVPKSFEIYSEEGLSVKENGDAKELSWDVKLKRGEEINLTYWFDAPDVSPYLFLLGKLTIGEFEEKRNWQIASDTVTVRLNSATGNSCDTLCGSFGETCIDMGTDAAGTDNKYWHYGVSCTQPSADCSFLMTDRSQTCGGNPARWTNCRCEAAASAPTITNALINATSSVILNRMVKVNASVTDSEEDINTVLIQIEPPSSAAYNVSAVNVSGEFYNDTTILDEYGQWVFTFNADDLTGLNATSLKANDTLNNQYINVASIPYADLNTPANASVFDIIPLNVTLNATVYSADNGTIDVLFYVANSTATNNLHSFLVYKKANVVNGSDVSYNFTALPISNNSQDLRALLHFDNDTSFDNDTKVFDWSNHGNHYDLFNGAFYNSSDGKFGYSLDLDGVNQYASSATDNGIVAYPFTFSSWVIFEGNKNGSIVELIKDNGENGEDIFGIGSNEAGNAHIYACTSTSAGFGCGIADVDYSTSSSKLDINWHHVVGVFESATERRLYVDGINVINGTTSFNFDTTTDSVYIGSGGFNQVSNFSGLIDEVGIWNRSLSTNEVKNLFKVSSDKYFWKVNITNDGGKANESFEREFNVTGVPTSLRSCGALNLTGETYTLENNVTSTATCFTIDADNVTLEGNGKLINYSLSSGGKGIESADGHVNTTIKNVIIFQGGESSSSHGIDFDSSNDSTIKDVNITTAGSTCQGITIGSATINTSIEDVYITTLGSTAIGILITGSDENTLANPTISTSGKFSEGIRINGADFNSITNIDINTSENGAYGIFVITSTFNTISNGSINASREVSIAFSGANAGNNNFSNIFLYGLNKTKPQLDFLSAGINGTSFINMPYIENYSFTGSGGTITVENTTFGEVRFLTSVNGSGGNFTNDIRIENNSAIVESANNIGLNKSANVTLYGTPGVGVLKPEVLKDGASCGVACYNFTSLEASIVTFNVTSWSNFSIGDKTPPTITINSIGDDTASAYSTSDNTPTANITTNENADCFASLDGDETYDGMSDDVNCTGDTTTNHICSFTSEISDTASQGVAFACRDTPGNKNDAGNNNDVTIEVDTVIPNQSDWSPANLSTITTTSPTITFNITENGDCKWSLADQSYDAMTGDCTGDGTKDHTCVTSGLTEGSDIVYLACSDDTDAFPNNDSATTNWLVNYTIDSIPPNVTINFPDVIDYNSSHLPFNFNVSLSENGSVTYSLDGGFNNITMISTDENSAFGLLFNGTNGSIADGEYNFSVYANDTLGNNNFSQYVNFSLDTSGAISISLSSALSSQINWTVNGTNVVNQSAEKNNGTGPTEYFVNISVEGGTTADLYVRANSDLLTSDGDLLGLGNETVSFNSTNSSVPSIYGFKLTTDFADTQIGSNLGTSTVYLKFFIAVPIAQPAGNYNNTLEFKAVKKGVAP